MILLLVMVLVILIPPAIPGPSSLVCAGCHPKETAAFKNSPMGRSIGAPQSSLPSGKASERQSGSVINIYWSNGRMVHRLTELGFRANYLMDYQIGAGKVGESFLVRMGDYLLQSPASYYRHYGWDISPGFQEKVMLDFDRVVTSQCLFCHSSSVDFIGKRRLAPGAQIEPISCSRCHGDTQQHVGHPSRANISNPVRLDIRARDSICEQCHLEGLARILNPGKQWTNFRPAEPLEETFSVYVASSQQPDAKVVSQVEQLALSHCARASGGKFWCGTCHNPHPIAPVAMTTKVSAVCTGCHPKLSMSAHSAATSDCVKCHMPRLSPNDVAHSATTDHRILAKPTQLNEAADTSLRAWHEPPAGLEKRNLGLAALEASAIPTFQSLGEVGGHLLQELPADQQENDPVVLAALADVALSNGDIELSKTLFLKAARLSPSNAEYMMYLGICLNKKGEQADAIVAFRKAIDLDSSLQRAYLELSALYAKQQRISEAAGVLKQYLKWNPQNIRVRSTLAELQ